MKALISNLKREMEETRVANSQISLERDEAIARNECLAEIVNKVHKKRAGGRRDLIDSSSPDSRGSPLIFQSVLSPSDQGYSIHSAAPQHALYVPY